MISLMFDCFYQVNKLGVTYTLSFFKRPAIARAAVKRMAEFAEKSKFELVGDPVEMKQAKKEITYQQCENLARAMAGRLKKDRV